MSLKAINDVVQKVMESLPPGIKTLPDDIKKHLNTMMVSTLDQLNVVTREEFEAQQKVLQATREKLEKLEKEINELSRK